MVNFKCLECNIFLPLLINGWTSPINASINFSNPYYQCQIIINRSINGKFFYPIDYCSNTCGRNGNL